MTQGYNTTKTANKFLQDKEEMTNVFSIPQTYSTKVRGIFSANLYNKMCVFIKIWLATFLFNQQQTLIYIPSIHLKKFALHTQDECL